MNDLLEIMKKKLMTSLRENLKVTPSIDLYDLLKSTITNSYYTPKDVLDFTWQSIQNKSSNTQKRKNWLSRYDRVIFLSISYS